MADGIDDERPVVLCPSAATALRAGACAPICTESPPGSVVCPLGFRGARKVIERQVKGSASGRSAPRALMAAPDVERHMVSLGTVYAAASARADHNDARAWTSAAKDLGDATLAGTWRVNSPSW